jgi:hypothetical protein
LPLALPHPGWKSGTFYLAEKRNFLLCVDSLGPPQSTQGQMSQSASRAQVDTVLPRTQLWSFAPPDTRGRRSPRGLWQ